MPDNKHFRFPAILSLGLLLTGFFQVARVSALNITPKMMAGTDFRSYGLAQFAVHDYKLTREMVDAINFGLKNLVGRHQQTFGRRLPAGFTVRYRIFEKYEDYKKFALVKYKKKLNENVLGFFSPRGREIVTWKQKQPWRLLPTAQHEGCHAIMNALFGPLPFWMIEGSADWFGEEPSWLQSKFLVSDKRDRWQRLDNMRRTGKLPSLETYLLTKDYDAWSKMFDGEIGVGYDVGWSIFDFFISSGRRANVDWPRQILAEAVRVAQQNPKMAPEDVFKKVLDAKWPQGGTKMFERGWHYWIKINAESAAAAKIKERPGRRQQ